MFGRQNNLVANSQSTVLMILASASSREDAVSYARSTTGLFGIGHE